MGPINLNTVNEKIWEQNPICELITENKEMSNSQQDLSRANHVKPI